MSLPVSEPQPKSHESLLWSLGVAAVAVLWWLVYGQLSPVAEWLVSLLPVERTSHTGEALAFFFYDVPKVMMLLTGVVFAMGVVRSFLQPGKKPGPFSPASARAQAMCWRRASAC